MRARGVGLGPNSITPAGIRRGLLEARHAQAAREAADRARPSHRLVLILVGCALAYTALLWFLEVPW